MTITSYKGRTIDYTQQVSVYFNLHLKVWSIKQGTVVVAHATEIALKDCITRISQAGRERVIRERSKNVHAYIVGFLVPHAVAEPENTMYYNPYKVKTFVDGDTMEPVTAAELVKLNSDRTVFYK